MKFTIAVFIVLSMSGASLADNAASRFKIEMAGLLSRRVIAGCVLTAPRHAVSPAMARGPTFKHAMTG
jgi:hypothetical protein